MQIIEYDPSLSPSEWKIGESYWFIRNSSNDCNKDISYSKSDAEGGVTSKDGGKDAEGGVTSKDGGKDARGGVTLRETTSNKVDGAGVTAKRSENKEENQYIDENTGEKTGGVTLKNKAAASSKDAINVESIAGNPTGIRYGRYIKQIGKVVNKEKQPDGSMYLFVEFDTSQGKIGRKFKCPMNADMYYALEKMINNSGEQIVL